jgi:pimeloyl-ACP methyl ester carboxylesterase
MGEGTTKTGMADVNGTRLYYEIRGSGPTILFLHGFTLDRRTWNHQVEALANRFRVVTYDARGFGRSAMPTTEAYRHCDDAAALCEHLSLSPVVAVGHSIGGHQTLEFALTRPDLVAGWVSVCTAGLAGIPFPEELTKTFAAVRQAAREEGIAAAKRIWIQSGLFKSARRIPALASELDAMFGDYSGWHWTHDNPATNLEPPAVERLGSLRIPVLVVMGARDLAYDALVGEKLVDAILGATPLRLPHAGHMANMEDPEAVNSAIAELARRAFKS